jgi:integrase
MSRRSYQKGYVSDPIPTRNGPKFVIRYRVRTSEGRWQHKAETLYGLSGKKAAREVLDRRISETSTQRAPTQDLTLTQFIDSIWRSHLLGRQQIKPSTLGGYESMLKRHITPALGSRILAEITPMHIERLLQSKSNLSPKTRRNLVVLLQGIFSLAKDDDLIEKSPIRERHKPAVIKHEKPVWTPEQVRAIIDSVPERYRALIACAALTGARLGELLGLQWKRIEFDGRKLRIEQSLWHGRLVDPKTKGSFRTVLFGEALAKALTNHLQNSQHIGPEDFVFSKPDGSTLDPDMLRRDVLYPALDRLGIPRSSRSAGFHTFRHSVGSFINAQTGNLKLAQKLLGHSNLSTTADIYTHTNEESEREAAIAVERAVYGELFSNVLNSENKNKKAAIQ